MRSTQNCATQAANDNSTTVFDFALSSRFGFFFKRNNRLMWLFRIYL